MLGVLLAFLAAVGWGSSAILLRLGMQRVRPITAAAIAIFSGFLAVFFIAILVHPREIFSISGVALGWFALLGLLTHTVGRVSYFNGLHLAGVARATPIIATTPIFATLLALTVGSENLKLITLVGTLLVVGGITLIFSERREA